MSHEVKMKLVELLKSIKVKNNIKSFLELDIQKISSRSQDNLNNSLFFCYNGSHDPQIMAKNAVANGAVAIVCDKFYDVDVLQILVDDVREAMASIAQTFFNTKDVKVIGITGTNGKTTTSFIIADILKSVGKKVGIIGTNGVYFANTFLPSKLTTPDVIDLHEMFSIMKKGGVDYVVMEVSAHAISLKKILGINFICKVLTNVSQDHLDYFKTLDEYKKVKLSFFDNLNDLMVVNADDEVGQQILHKYDTAISYGINCPSDSFCIDINKDCNSYIMNICDNVIKINSKLYGLFNVYNCLAGATCCYFLGISIDQIQNALCNLKPVDGRFNVIKYNDKTIIIDYAHTPDGLENVLKTSRKMTNNKLICVFGCGGDRDKSKRPIMGAVAEKYSDYCFITSDNPRFENPKNILSDIQSGFNDKNYYITLDRKTAIKLAINSLKGGDTLIICGKGGENYIDIKGEKLPYSDFETVKEILGTMK